MTVALHTFPEINAPGGPARRRILVADVAGFCFGVRRAVDMTRALRRERGGDIIALGPLVHNPQVTQRLQAEGVGQAATLDAIAGGTVVLSAHGVGPDTLARAQAKGLQILDTTCPFVTKVHRTARQLHEQGYQVVLVGDAGHTEVRGVLESLAAVGASADVISTPEEAHALPLGKKVGIVSQTTQRARDFGAIVGAICERASDVRAVNTICNATDELQDAAVRLARQCDVVLVIGGRQSANTRRLRELCAAQGVPAYHIETPDEIEEGWLADKGTVGLTAGASTPDWIIEDTARRCNGGVLPEGWHLHHPDE